MNTSHIDNICHYKNSTYRKDVRIGRPIKSIDREADGDIIGTIDMWSIREDRLNDFDLKSYNLVSHKWKKFVKGIIQKCSIDNVIMEAKPEALIHYFR